MPSQYRVGFDDIGHFFELLPAELFTNVDQRFTLGVGELDASLDLIS